MITERAPLPRVVHEPAAGRVVAFAPHADDEVLGCGGVLALHALQGDDVTVIVAFDGRSGLAPGTDPIVRKRESRAALAHLGIDDVRFLDRPEGHEPNAAEFRAAVDDVAALVGVLAPRTVYAPWIGEHHLDHHVCARVVMAALDGVHFDGDAWAYEVWTPLVPTHVVDIDPVIHAKRAALGEYSSQLERTDLVHAGLGLAAQRSLFLPASKWGEALRRLG